MLSQPWWISYLNIIIEKSINVEPGVTIAGWVLVGLAIVIYFVNRWHEKKVDNSVKDHQCSHIGSTQELIEPSDQS